jgi:hypothetical protein
MFADVTFAEGSQNRVTDRVQEDVGIGMSQQAKLVRDIHSAENEFSFRH